MAITKSIVFQNIGIANSTGGATNTYELPVTESMTVTIEPVIDTVGAGRSLPASYDISGEVRLLNTNVYNDPFVYGSNTAAEPVLGRITFRGVSGAINLNIGPTFINGRRDYGDNNRAGVVLNFTERVTNVEAFIIES